jgi:pyruvate,water dikinase
VKAARLAALRQAGFPVPAGFVVPANVFRIAPHGEITPDVEAAIAAAYATLGDQLPVAVRSSATPGADTPGAGQFAAFLGVVGVAKIVRQIERCWQSASDPRAQAYYHQAGIEADQVALAVLVQRQVEAAASGSLDAADSIASAADLSAAQNAELQQLGQRVSAHIGQPQQIEWALSDNQWWIIQVQPVAARQSAA